MAKCKFCEAQAEWAQVDGRYVLLVPKGEEAGLFCEFQDSTGALRASHRQVCTHNKSGPLLFASRLSVPIFRPSVEGKVDQETGEILPSGDSA